MKPSLARALLAAGVVLLLLQTLTAAGVAGLPSWSGWGGLTTLALSLLTAT